MERVSGLIAFWSVEWYLIVPLLTVSFFMYLATTSLSIHSSIIVSWYESLTVIELNLLYYTNKVIYEVLLWFQYNW